jgi:transcriptional regulator with XRE-family HTH domain
VPNLRPRSFSQLDLSPGKYLKEVRQHLGMALREVQEASTLLAEEESNEEIYISAARLDQIENEPSAPSIHKLLSLSAIYGIDFLDLLARYGVKPDRVHKYRKLLRQKATHPLSTELHDFETTVTVPIHMDPGFRWETTQLVNRMVAVWGEIPASLLMNFNPRHHTVGLVGLEDQTMSPLVKPGALLLVDGNRRRVINKDWPNEYERPIYFVELRDGYRCAWCQLADGLLTLIPHPLSGVLIESFNFPSNAEIVGQVVGVAMRIVPASEASLEH